MDIWQFPTKVYHISRNLQGLVIYRIGSIFVLKYEKIAVERQDYCSSLTFFKRISVSITGHYSPNVIPIALVEISSSASRLSITPLLSSPY